MTAAAVLGTGWVTAGGTGAGRSGAPFSAVPGPPLRLSRGDVFPEPNPRFGRLPDYSRAGLAAVAFALRDAGMERCDARRPIGIAASTRLGCLSIDIEYYETVVREGGKLASPNLFAYTLPSCFLGDAAIQFGLTGPTWIVNGDSGDTLSGVRAALEQISFGECDTLLAGHIDLPAGPPYAGPLPDAAGAMFLVLSGVSEPGGNGYGTLGLSDGGGILHEENPVTGLPELLRSCLERFRAREGGSR